MSLFPAEFDDKIIFKVKTIGLGDVTIGPNGYKNFVIPAESGYVPVTAWVKTFGSSSAAITITCDTSGTNYIMGTPNGTITNLSLKVLYIPSGNVSTS